MDCDVIVVGAGQAGCSAAYDLAAKGLKVIILDRCSFPRRKACGGCLTTKAVNSLAFSITSVCRRVGSDLQVADKYKRPHVWAARSTTHVMTIRAELDALCLNMCLAQGATFLVAKSISAIQETDEQVSLMSDWGTISARYCLGADGANSTVRRLTGEFQAVSKGCAIEATVCPVNPERYRTEFDFFVVSYGYGWIFPKGDHLNVGLYTCSSSVALDKDMLTEYVRRKIGDLEIRDVAAHTIGFHGWKYRPKMRRVFLVGDAAGLVDPLLGEGIYNAIRSGQAAAGAILSANENGLDAQEKFREALAPIQSDLLSCANSAKWFYRFPRLCFFVMLLPTTKSLFMKGYSAGFTFHTIKCRPWRIVMSRLKN